jgi:serine O-acetyltransferase
MFENLRHDLRKYATSAHSSEIATRVPTWLRLLVRSLFRVEVQAIIIYRYGNWAHKLSVPPAGLLRVSIKLWRLFHLAIHFVLAKIWLILSGVYLAATATIGPGIVLAHPGPVYIHPEAVIGRDVMIYPGVVVGGDHSRDGAPRIGDNVALGSGCKVLGPITIGDNVVIGANAVVVKDVPSNALAVGVPAVVKKRVWTKKRPDGTYELP